MFDNLNWRLEDGKWTLRVEDDCEYIDNVGGDFVATVSKDNEEDGWTVEIEQEMRASPVDFWYPALDDAKKKGREEFDYFIDRWRRNVAENNRRRELKIDW